MRKIIILLLCCGVLVSMVGCGDTIIYRESANNGNTVSETIITETPTETTPPETAVEPTHKEKEPPPRERGSGNRVDRDRHRAYNNSRTNRRYKSLASEKNFFQCGGYQTKGGTHCTAHYIREQVLDEIVLGRVQKMTAFTRENPEEFYAMTTENGEAKAKKFYAMAERQRNSLESRIKEIDKIIRCLYEDRVVGRISPARYDELASGYELEQTEIKQELESITARIAKMDMRDICVKEFIAKAKEIVDMDKLTPKILQAFVLRTDVYEKAEKFSRKCGNYIEIHYTFQPKPRTTSKTAVSTIAVLPMELQMATANA